jgi:hypothetical protein
MKHLNDDFVSANINLKTEEEPRAILKLCNPNEQSLPISGGWGHTFEHSVIINKNDPSVNPDTFNGLEIEYAFVEQRIYAELISGRPMEERFRDLKWIQKEQNLLNSNGRMYDHLHYSVNCLNIKDWNYLNQIFLENNEFNDNPKGLEKYLKEKEDLKYCFDTHYWFDITSFFYSK